MKENPLTVRPRSPEKVGGWVGRQVVMWSPEVGTAGGGQGF